jgi:hypothetical protein
LSWKKRALVSDSLEKLNRFCQKWANRHRKRLTIHRYHGPSIYMVEIAIYGQHKVSEAVVAVVEPQDE